jgi:dTDP-4-amino-4,6-dideoxygalactose transaminase
MEILRIEKELDNLEAYLQGCQNSAKLYDEYLEGAACQKLGVSTDCTSSYLKYPVILKEKAHFWRCIKALNRAGFRIDYRYRPLHLSPFFGSINAETSYDDSVFLSEHLLPLPIERNMAPETVEKVVSVIKQATAD